MTINYDVHKQQMKYIYICSRKKEQTSIRRVKIIN